MAMKFKPTLKLCNRMRLKSIQRATERWRANEFEEIKMVVNWILSFFFCFVYLLKNKNKKKQSRKMGFFCASKILLWTTTNGKFQSKIHIKNTNSYVLYDNDKMWPKKNENKKYHLEKLQKDEPNKNAKGYGIRI